METATIKCPTCGSEFPAGARFCPKCGYVVPATVPHAVEPPPAQVVYVDQPATASWTPWVTGIIVALLVAGGVALASMGYFGGEKQPAVAVTTAPETPQQPQDINITLPPEAASTPPAPAQQDINITLPPGSTLPPATPPPAQPPATPPAPSGSAPEIVSVRAEALETGTVDWNYGYTLKLRNTTSRDASAQYKITFLDSQGYVVDDDLTDVLTVPANSEKTFAGADLIRAELAATIKSVKAEIR